MPKIGKVLRYFGELFFRLIDFHNKFEKTNLFSAKTLKHAPAKMFDNKAYIKTYKLIHLF